MKDIEEGLYTVHAEIKAKKSQSEESGMDVGTLNKIAKIIPRLIWDHESELGPQVLSIIII